MIFPCNTNVDEHLRSPSNIVPILDQLHQHLSFLLLKSVLCSFCSPFCCLSLIVCCKIPAHGPPGYLEHRDRKDATEATEVGMSTEDGELAALSALDSSVRTICQIHFSKDRGFFSYQSHFRKS